MQIRPILVKNYIFPKWENVNLLDLRVSQLLIKVQNFEKLLISERIWTGRG